MTRPYDCGRYLPRHLPKRGGSPPTQGAGGHGLRHEQLILSLCTLPPSIVSRDFGTPLGSRRPRGSPRPFTRDSNVPDAHHLVRKGRLLLSTGQGSNHLASPTRPPTDPRRNEGGILFHEETPSLPEVHTFGPQDVGLQVPWRLDPLTRKDVPDQCHTFGYATVLPVSLKRHFRPWGGGGIV